MKKVLAAIFIILPILVFVILVGAIFLGIATPNEVALINLLGVFSLLVLKIKQPLAKIGAVIFYAGIILLTALELNLIAGYLLKM